MIKWIFVMPFVWLMDYFYGMINPDFREIYINFEENLTTYLLEQQEQSKEVENE